MIAVTTKPPMSKRQRRKLPNDKHQWPQQPRIQDMARREKAQIRVSGLMDKPLEPEVKFGRLLGASDQRVRHRAILGLQEYLKARCNTDDFDESNDNGLSELDLLKLWKGMWCTLYMADKAAVQDELAVKIAQLIWSVAGNEEEDEFAGQAYLEMYGDEVDSDNDDDYDDDMNDYDDDVDDNDAEGADEKENDDDDDDGSEVELEEIENTLEVDDADSDNNVDNEEMDEDDEDEDDEDDDEIDPEEEMKDNDDDSVDNSELRHCRGAHLAALMIRTFFRTVRREWDKMDKYRVDKFYTLIRYMMHEVFKYMAVRHWSLGIIRLFNDAIFQEVLSQTPNGIRFHIVDVALDELAKVNAKAPLPLTEGTFVDCLEPYLSLMQTGAGDTALQAHVTEKILLKFLDKYSIVSDNYKEKEDGGEDKKDSTDNGGADNKDDLYLVMDQVHVESVAQLIFEVAGSEDTKSSYRKILYGVYKKYMSRIKLTGRDVDVPHAEIDDDDVEDVEEDGDNVMADENDEAPVYAKDDDDDDDVKMSDSGKKTKEKRSAERKDANADSIDTSDDMVAQEETKQKKSKKKKKHEKADKESVETAVTKNNAGVTQETDKDADAGEQVSKKKNKKKKKSKDKKNAVNDESNDKSGLLAIEKDENSSKGDAATDKLESTTTTTEESNSNGSSKKKNKKKKKRKSTDSEASAALPDDDGSEKESVTKAEQESEDESKRSKKKRKKNGKDKSKEDKDVAELEDEVMTISMADQRKSRQSTSEEEERRQDKSLLAKFAMTKNRPSIELKTPERRVKFDNENQARSFKVSMKKLVEAQPTTPKATPEQSILRKKDRPATSSKDDSQKSGKVKKRKSRKSV